MWEFYNPYKLTAIEAEETPAGAISMTMEPMTGASSEDRAKSAPSGYLFCNGAVLNISEFPTLYAKIGASFGGNGVTTFALPDFTGEAAAPTGSFGRLPYGAGGSFSTFATAGGSSSHSHTTTAHGHAVPNHAHNMSAAYLTHTHGANHRHSLGWHTHTQGSATVGNASPDVNVISSSPPPAVGAQGVPFSNHVHPIGHASSGPKESNGTTNIQNEDFTLTTGAPTGVASTTDLGGAHTSTTSAPGTSTDNHMPPSLSLNFMIKV